VSGSGLAPEQGTRRSFSDSPEARAKRAAAAPAKPSGPSLQQMAHSLAAAEARDDLAVARWELAEAQAQAIAARLPHLDPVEAATEMELYAQEYGFDALTLELAEAWGEVDPVSSSEWLGAQRHQLALEAIEQESAEAAAAIEADDRRIANQVEEFYARRPQATDPRTQDLLRGALQTAGPEDLTPEALPGTLEGAYGAARSAGRAIDGANREAEFRSEFRKAAALAGGLFGSAARKHLQQGEHGGALELRPESQPADPTFADAAVRIGREVEASEANRAVVDETRAAFAAEAQHRLDTTVANRAGAARAEQARTEVESLARQRGRGL
jgi:hypothetical protein